MKLRIEKPIYGGHGLARLPQDESGQGGKAVFVPLALPGELVEAEIAEERRGYSIAALRTVVEASPERVSPGCEYFSQCGGCHYQHASGQEQLTMKLAILRETLTRAHIPVPEPIEVLHGEPWSYRNRIRLHVQASPAFALCYRRRGSNENLPVTHCPIAAPLLERAIAALSQAGAEAGLGRICNEMELFTNEQQDALLLSLFTTRNRPRGQRLLEELLQRFQAVLPELTGMGLFLADDRKRGGAIPRKIAACGEASLRYAAGEHEYSVSLGSFFQTNRHLVPALLWLVTGGRSGRTAWDLYSGVGLFARALHFENVVAVEPSPASFSDLRRNLAGTPHRAVQATALQFLRSSGKGAQPDLVLADPPRAGLGSEVCALLAQAAPREIVCVSCDPATLSRDLQSLLQSGYRLQAMHLVDLFPQTFHLETVAVLTRD